MLAFMLVYYSLFVHDLMIKVIKIYLIGNGNSYNSLNSTTYKANGKRIIDLKDKGSTFAGFYSIDTVRIDNLTATNQTFMEVVSMGSILN